MEIQVIIPVGNHKNLGQSYNRLMQTVKDWVCFLDHDVLQLNPSWYSMCISAVERTGHSAGWITGVTNAIACSHQFCADAPKNDSVIHHMEYAKRRHNKYGNRLDLVDHRVMTLPFSGFMILTHKKAWEETGGFTDGFLGVDNEYFKALVHKGYTAYIIPGLYMYHLYHKKKAWTNL